jgi:hypothetical protein
MMLSVVILSVIYAEWHIFIAMSSVIMPSVVMLSVVMLNVVVLNDITLDVIMLSASLPSVVMLSFVNAQWDIFNCYVECHYDEYHYAEVAL